MRLLLSILLIASAAAYAATRDFVITWEQPLLTVDGDELAKVDGFRLYTSDGTFVKLLPGEDRTATVRINRPWGETCFKMRSFYIADGIEYESADSNVGACQTINPGKPVAPEVAE